MKSNTDVYTLLNEAVIRIEALITQNEKLNAELREANDYSDRLVEHKDMVCLPADLANLRAANAQFAIENEELKRERDELREKIWELTTLLQEHKIIGYND